MSQITDLQKHIHDWAIRKQWRGPDAIDRPLVADFALFHSEISEALEEIRKDEDPRLFWFSYTVTMNGLRFKNLTEEQVEFLRALVFEDPIVTIEVSDPKPEGVGPEMADLVIRVFETAEEYGLDMDFEIERKMAYNEGREIRHGGLLL